MIQKCIDTNNQKGQRVVTYLQTNSINDLKQLYINNKSNLEIIVNHTNKYFVIFCDELSNIIKSSSTKSSKYNN